MSETKSKKTIAKAAPLTSKAAAIAAVNERVHKERVKVNPNLEKIPAAFLAAGNEHLLDFGVIPWGNPVLDRVTGGNPRGLPVQIYGSEGSGKSRSIFDCIAASQARDPDFYAMYIHLEARTFPLSAAIAAGVDPSRLLVINALASAEKTFNIAFRYLWNRDAMAPMELEDGRPLIDLVAIDSVAAVEADAEVAGILGDKGLEGADVALQARLMSKFFRFLCGAGALGKTALILVNQERVDVGAYSPRGVVKKPTGGMAVGYYAKITTKLQKTELVREGGERGPVIGHKVAVTNIKNNTNLAYPQLTGEYTVIYGQGVDTAGPLLDLALDYGLILEPSAGRFVAPDRNLETGEILPPVLNAKKIVMSGRKVVAEEGVPGRQVMIQLLRDEQWLQDYLQDEIAKRMTQAAEDQAPDTGAELDDVEVEEGA